jgi:6,7-dimethyl-8-ribityllumazine synthase
MKPAHSTHIQFTLTGLRFGIIAARYNNAIVDGLLRGALDALERHGVMRDQVKIVQVPGAFEIPLAAQQLAATGHYAGLIALGVVIRGETPHFDYVAGNCTQGIAQLGLEYNIPIGFGVLTVNTEQQAIERSGPDAGNKGVEAALAMLQMVQLLHDLEQEHEHAATSGAAQSKQEAGT